ncbi:hypothetical protein BGW80DRAFT_28201 [Lactifluus volemus]|nr:hypothetical protein BGW80DRAFT_28201 [Lactifluus volemus]
MLFSVLRNFPSDPQVGSDTRILLGLPSVPLGWYRIHWLTAAKWAQALIQGMRCEAYVNPNHDQGQCVTAGTTSHNPYLISGSSIALLEAGHHPVVEIILAIHDSKCHPPNMLTMIRTCITGYRYICTRTIVYTFLLRWWDVTIGVLFRCRNGPVN